jgi:DNA-binding response OmpR family regulator
MLIAVEEDRDVPLAQSLAMAAARRGHLAKRVTSLQEIPRVLPADPDVIVLSAARIDRVILDRLVQVRGFYDRALILLVVEEASASETMTALEHGAACVLPKPLAPSEVVAWLERLPQLQRSTPRKRSVADLDIELDEMRATKAGRELMLTRSEFHLLLCLVEHAGRLTSTDRLLTFGSDLDEIAHSSLKTHMSRLRQKLRVAGGIPIRISAKQLLGYVLEPASLEEPGAKPERIDSNSEASAQARDAAPSERLTPHSPHLPPNGSLMPRKVQSLTA